MKEVVSTLRDYIYKRDWRVRENANQGYSYGGLIHYVSSKATAIYLLENVYSPSIAEAHRTGAIHIHDLGNGLAPYCAGWSLRDLLWQGYGGVPGQVNSKPPRHLQSALNQMAAFLGTIQGEWAGAQAFSDFSILLAPYVKIDRERVKDLDWHVKQCVQHFVFDVNRPSRWQAQTPFTNITLNWNVPEKYRNEHPIIAGETMPFTYGDCEEEMWMINAALMDVYLEGDRDGRVLTYPIPTVNVTKDFQWNHPVTDKLFEVTAKYGLPYFQNFVNSDLNEDDIRSMCCRLRLDLTELRKKGNGLFGSGDQTGSIGVVTINLARLGYKHKGDLQGLYRELDELLEIAKDALEVKRELLVDMYDLGLYPYTAAYLPQRFRTHFSTIGVNGANEMILNFTDGEYGIADPRGQKMAIDLLKHIRERCVDFQRETGHLYNLEATPAEGATYRFALRDREAFGEDIIQAGSAGEPYYTNSTQLPVNHTNDILAVLDHQNELQQLYTGGTVVHLYIAEEIQPQQAKKLMQYVMENYEIPYVTITPIFSVCPDHGYFPGKHFVCPACGKTTEVWTRVMGYHRPFHSFNAGKQSEFLERVPFVLRKDV